MKIYRPQLRLRLRSKLQTLADSDSDSDSESAALPASMPSKAQLKRKKAKDRHAKKTGQGTSAQSAVAPLLSPQKMSRGSYRAAANASDVTDARTREDGCSRPRSTKISIIEKKPVAQATVCDCAY